MVIPEPRATPGAWPQRRNSRLQRKPHPPTRQVWTLQRHAARGGTRPGAHGGHVQGLAGGRCPGAHGGGHVQGLAGWGRCPGARGGRETSRGSQGGDVQGLAARGTSRGSQKFADLPSGDLDTQERPLPQGGTPTEVTPPMPPARSPHTRPQYVGWQGGMPATQPWLDKVCVHHLH